ncbi:class I SAM-dependent methyltransferase [Streptomyces capparidis]
MSHVQAFYESVYSHTSPFGGHRAPWDIGEPQPALAALTDTGAVRGEVLDAGSGTGELSLFLAARGYAVTGVDLSPAAVETAAARAEERGLYPVFVVGDLLDLSPFPARFDTVVECGVLQGFDDAQRARYAGSLHAATRPGALVHLLNLSAEGRRAAAERGAAHGVPDEVLADLRGPDPEDLRAVFTDGWAEESIVPATIKTMFPAEGGRPAELPAWLATFRHT